MNRIVSTPARHKTSPLLLFDDGEGQFGPMTDLRPAFELRCGALTSRQRIERVLHRPASSLHVPAPLASLVLDRCTDYTVNEPPAPCDWFVVNGRWNGVSAAAQLAELPLGHALLQQDGQIIAAHLSAKEAQQLAQSNWKQLPDSIRPNHVDSRALYNRPWHIQDDLPDVLADDLDASTVPIVPELAPRWPGTHHFGAHPLRISAHAHVQPTAVFNTELGPIVVDYDALIGATAVIEGPAYIGPGSQITCHTHIRPHTVIGPMCKIGGEVSHSIVFGHSNKAHRGYLGNSLVGEWVNLGAETNVSNLKNTYGVIQTQLEANEKPQSTGRTGLGPIIGDFVRTAIGSRILSGSCIATAAMLALSSFCPKYVERFAFLTDDVRELHDIDRFLETAQRMMARRGIALSAAEEAALRTLHSDTLPPPRRESP